MPFFCLSLSHSPIYSHISTELKQMKIIAIIANNIVNIFELFFHKSSSSAAPSTVQLKSIKEHICCPSVLFLRTCIKPVPSL